MLLLRLTPEAPSTIRYQDLWPQILARLVVKHSDVNKITALRQDKLIGDSGSGKGQARASGRLSGPQGVMAQ